MVQTKEIRQELKNKLGYNARQVSVRMMHYTKIIFTIRDASIKRSEIEDFANDYESIRYDEMTGEILCGGNTYVDVCYSEDCKKEMSDKYIEAVEKAVNQIEDNCIIDIEGTNLSIGNDPRYSGGFAIWEYDEDGIGTCISHCYSIESVAFTVAEHALNNNDPELEPEPEIKFVKVKEAEHCTVNTMSEECFTQIDNYLSRFKEKLIGETVEETTENIMQRDQFVTGCFTYLQAIAFAEYYMNN